MTATVTMRERRSAGGTSFFEADGTVYTMTAAQAAEYVQKGWATYIPRPDGAPVPAMFATDAEQNVNGLKKQDGELIMQFIEVGGESAAVNVEV